MNPDLTMALEVMAKGMTGIFTALSVVFILVIVLVKAFPEKSGTDEEE